MHSVSIIENHSSVPVDENIVCAKLAENGNDCFLNVHGMEVKVSFSTSTEDEPAVMQPLFDGIECLASETNQSGDIHLRFRLHLCMDRNVEAPYIERPSAQRLFGRAPRSIDSEDTQREPERTMFMALRNNSGNVPEQKHRMSGAGLQNVLPDLSQAFKSQAGTIQRIDALANMVLPLTWNDSGKGLDTRRTMAGHLLEMVKECLADPAAGMSSLSKSNEDDRHRMAALADRLVQELTATENARHLSFADEPSELERKFFDTCVERVRFNVRWMQQHAANEVLDSFDLPAREDTVRASLLRDLRNSLTEFIERWSAPKGRDRLLADELGASLQMILYEFRRAQSHVPQGS